MRQFILTAVVTVIVSTAAFAAVPVATYEFNNTFAANQGGAPAMTATDPLGTSVFMPDIVAGQPRTVWAFNGGIANADQAGLTVNTTGLVAPQNYSVDMVFEFTSGANAWRRILDVQNRQSDAGLYVDPTNNLNIFPVSGSTASWSNNIYHHVVMTTNGTTVNAYLDGVSQFSANTNVLNLDFDPINNPNRLLGFFLDNVALGGQQEYGTGRIALARLWDGVLTGQEAQDLANNPFLPEPTSLSLLAVGAAIAFTRKRASVRS